MFINKGLIVEHNKKRNQHELDVTNKEDGPRKKNRLATGPTNTFVHELSDFIPSRGRDPIATALTGATGSQPSGAALPSLIRGEVSVPAEHVVAAGRVNPTATLLTAALPPRTRAIAHRCVKSPDVVISDRNTALLELRTFSDRLAPFRQRWLTSLPADSPARSLNFPVLHALAHRFQYEDKGFISELSGGMPIVGHVASSGVLRDRPQNARVDFQKWKAAIPATNTRAIDRVKRMQGSVVANK